MEGLYNEELTSNDDESQDVFSDISPKIGNSNSLSSDIVDVLRANEVRWFYSSPKKTWIPFLGYDSFRIEISYRQLHSTLKGLHSESFETISVRGDLYEVDIINKKCSPIYWNGDSVDVMRGTWFFDVGWQPLDEDYAVQIEVEHLSKFAGWKSCGTKFDEDTKIVKNFDINKISEGFDATGQQIKLSTTKPPPVPEIPPKNYENRLEISNIRSFSLISNSANVSPIDEYRSNKVPAASDQHKTGTTSPQQCSTAASSPGTERKMIPSPTHLSENEGHLSKPPSPQPDTKDNAATKARKDILKKKTGNYSTPVHTLKFKDFYVEWYSPHEIYMFSLATSSKLYRSLTYALGFQKTGLRLNRGYCILANDSDKPPEIQHLVFVIHGIGAKLDSSKCIRNCALMRDLAAKVKSKCFTDKAGKEIRAEFFPIEWRANLKLDDGAVDMISPKNVIGLRSILNTTVMDIMYYTSPIFRNEILTGVQRELNRLYQMFCQRHPHFTQNPQVNKVSIIAHSLGTVIIHDILSGWNPSYIHQNYVDQTLNECIENAESESDKQKWSQFAEKLKSQVVDIEKKLNYIRKDHNNLKFQVENLFLLGSPLAVFLVMRGISIYGRSGAAASIDINGLSTNTSNYNNNNNKNTNNGSGNEGVTPAAPFDLSKVQDVMQDPQKHTIIPRLAPVEPVGGNHPSSCSSRNSLTTPNCLLLGTTDNKFKSSSSPLPSSAFLSPKKPNKNIVLNKADDSNTDDDTNSPPKESLQRELEKMDKKKTSPTPPPQPSSSSSLSPSFTKFFPGTGRRPQPPVYNEGTSGSSTFNSDPIIGDEDRHKKHEKHSYKPKISVLLPKHICRHVYNIYHPADPVAYRLEPLIALQYIRVKPVPVLRHDLSNKNINVTLCPIELYPPEEQQQPTTDSIITISPLLPNTENQLFPVTYMNNTASLAPAINTQQQQLKCSSPPPIPPFPKGDNISSTAVTRSLSHPRIITPPPPAQPLSTGGGPVNKSRRPPHNPPSITDALLEETRGGVTVSTPAGNKPNECVPVIPPKELDVFSELSYDGLKLKYYCTDEISDDHPISSKQQLLLSPPPPPPSHPCEISDETSLKQQLSPPTEPSSYSINVTSTTVAPPSTAYYSYLPRASLDFIRGYWYRSSSTDKGDNRRGGPDDHSSSFNLERTEMDNENVNHVSNNGQNRIEDIHRYPSYASDQAQINISAILPEARASELSLKNHNSLEKVKIKYFHNVNRPSSRDSNKKKSLIKTASKGGIGVELNSEEESGVVMLDENNLEIKQRTPENLQKPDVTPSLPILNINSASLLVKDATSKKNTVKKKSITSKLTENLIKRDSSSSATKKAGESAQTNLAQDSENLEETIPKLEYRVDYTLPAGWSFVNTYVSAITAHTSYWSNPDVMYFIIQHLFPDNDTSTK